MKQKQVLCFKGVEDVEEEIVTFLIGNYLFTPDLNVFSLYKSYYIILHIFHTLHHLAHFD